MHGQLLYENDRTRVSRTVLPTGERVIRKEFRGSAAARRLRHELSVLRRLAGVPGVPDLVTAVDQPDVICLADAGGVPLTTLLTGGPLPVDELLELAVELATVIAAVHRHGVMHKDINPANVIAIGGSPSRPVLIDYDLASTFAVERPGFTHHTEIAGTLAYMAPEQTGRTGWAVDQRADLYGLGSTLYELATGGPPFGDGDPLQLTHDHLTRVPTPPSEVNPDVPAALSAVIGRLLEKEPDSRYQSAEGALHDLRRLRQQRTEGRALAINLGERDFPWRLAAPSRPIGRDAEIALLADALADAVAGRCRGVLVSGPAGVGKTALIDELRPLVTGSGGWFVSGKFDQYRHDAGADAVRQALRSVGRMLLAEPEAELAGMRSRLLEAVGANVGLVAAVLPEFRTLLGVAPEVDLGDPTQVQVRLQQSALEIVRTVASPDRPLVILIDDLQWAGAVPIGFVDAILTDDGLLGVLLIGTYRDAEVDETHPLRVTLSRWRELAVEPTHLPLRNLPPADVSVLLADMLRVPMGEAAALASAIRTHTDGNPFDTVEFINALRRDGVLVPADEGWTWDPAAVHRHLGLGDVVTLLAARVAALPGRTRDVLATMSCLGGDVEVELLRAASGTGPVPTGQADLEDALAPALEDGLLVMEHGGPPSVRFRHDRVQQAAYGDPAAPARRARHLAVARRLAGTPGYGLVAADQYLAAGADLVDPAERIHVALMFRDAARHARLLANYAVIERFLTAAVGLVEAATAAGARGAGDTARLRTELDVERHAALFALGRFDEADRVYAHIAADCPEQLLRADADWVQVSSLLTRGRPGDAVALGLAAIADLGFPAPPAHELPAEIDRGVDALVAWAAGGTAEDDLRREPNTDPRVNAVARIIGRMIPAAYFSGMPVMAWLMTAAMRLWAQRGPSAALVGPVAHAAFVAIPLRRDYRTGHAAVRRVLTVSETLGYEPETSLARILYALSASPWFDPLEDGVWQARQARAGLLRGGDLQNAGHTFYASVAAAIDCATVDECMAEIEEGLALTSRTGNGHTAGWIVAYRQAMRAFRGETYRPGALSDPNFDEHTHLAGLGHNPNALGNFHLIGALTAAVFNDQPALVRHMTAAIPLMPMYEAVQATTFAHLFQALSLVGQIALAPPSRRPALVAEFETYRGWVADRAAEGPGNFLHLRYLLDAELAWAVGDMQAAMRQFDAAQREVESRQRPWQRAFIAERRGRFHLAHGMEYAGRAALRESLQRYREWGAPGKAEQLEAEFPFLQAADAAATARRTIDHRRSSSISVGTIDMLAVLRASQALSSETNLAGLQERVGEVLCAMTGATAVRLLLRGADDEWYLPQNDDPAGLPLARAADAGLVPVSVFRYVERTGEPLLLDDATRDDRFARDPYLACLPQCALLAVPVLTRGRPTAVLMLENRRSRGAFGANRLDTVQLIAGQLSVSLDNALLYSALERKVAQRTEALRAANDKLELLAVTDPLTGLPNRRQLTEVLSAAWRRAMCPGEPLAVAMVDVDHFKLYNDHYGHLAGDECLRAVATAIRRTLRETDLAARYGGEEFAIVLPGADLETARQIAERVRAAVAALGQPHEPAGHGVVTVSVGVAVTVPTQVATTEHLLKAADAELYQAKAAGRDRVAASLLG